MGNNIGDDGAMAIADALIVNRYLTKLNLLANNNITARGQECLSIMERVFPYIDIVWSK